jgi:predicted phage terminase large subunit-like protein
VEELTKDNPEVQKLLEECSKSTAVFASVMFHERFTRPFSTLHSAIFNILDNDDIQQAVIAAPRGFGKTSCVNMAYPAKRILFNESRFIVPISYSNTKAEKESENLKWSITTSEVIQKFGFPDLKSETWSKEQWVTSTGTMVFPRGLGQQVRGILHRNDRPDLIICDDVEDDKRVTNEELRAQDKEWFFSSVYGSTDKSKKSWRIIFIGTVLHEDSLLVNLLEDPNWLSVRLELCDDMGRSNWPDFMSDEEVAKLIDQYRQQGKLDSFYREYRNLVIATEDACFGSAMFSYYDEGEEKLNQNRMVESVVLVDPAKSVTPHSDDSAIVGGAFDSVRNHIYFRDCVAGKMYPDRLYDEVFRMAARLNAKVIGIEVTSLNEFITQPFINEMKRRGLSYTVVELKARGKKEERIRGLIPYYRQGLVRHNRAISGALEAQLLSFPRSKRDDIMDAFAYIVELLEVGNRYFLPKQRSIEAEEEAYQRLREEDRQNSGHKLAWRTI